MKKLIFCLMMLGLVSQADAQQKCNCKQAKKTTKSKSTAVAKKRTANKQSVARNTNKTICPLPNTGTSGLSLMNNQQLNLPALPLRNSVIMQDVRPWAGFAEDLRETREQSIAVPLPEYRDVATPENMEVRGEGQIPHRNIDMRGTNPAANSLEEDLEILNRHDKLRGKQVR